MPSYQSFRAEYLPHKMIHVDFLPAGAIQAVEDGVGEVVSMRLGRKPPCEFDEAGGDERGHEVTRG